MALKPAASISFSPVSKETIFMFVLLAQKPFLRGVAEKSEDA
jgi:hypothetical protein